MGGNNLFSIKKSKVGTNTCPELEKKSNMLPIGIREGRFQTIRVPKTSQGSQGIFQEKEVNSRLVEQKMQILCNKTQHAGFPELREGCSSGV